MAEASNTQLFSTGDANVHRLRRLGDQFLGTNMTESLLRTAHRKAIGVEGNIEPGPL